MNKNIIISMAVAAIIAGGFGFYGGIKYAQNKAPANSFLGKDIQNLTAEQRQQMQSNASSRQAKNAGGGNFVNGEIIAKDDKSITMKLGDSGTKIIFYSETTEIGKFTIGEAGDLEIGKTIMVNGKVNQDGSLIAQSIQIRPDNAAKPAQ